MIQYPQYQKKAGGKFLKLAELIPQEGDEVKLKLVDGKIEKGNFGVQQLIMDVLIIIEGKAEHKELSCDAPDIKNEMAGSQLYQGMVDNNIQPGDVFYVKNGGKMKNQYKTTIYNVLKDVTAPAPQSPQGMITGEMPMEEPPVENYDTF